MIVTHTTKACTVIFRDMHRVTIPAGTALTWIEGGTGGYAVTGPVQVDGDTGPSSIYAHDRRYYFLWAPDDVCPLRKE